MKKLLFLYLGLFILLSQQNDTSYTRQIKEFTTDPRFMNELVDHLPASSTVPSPLKHFGSIIGAPGILHYSDEIHGYLRALAAASPRVLVRNIGKSEENRDMIEVIIADEQSIANLENYRAYLNQLADPRKTNEAQAKDIINKAKPIYYLTSGLHSGEAGPPEMVMEMAYRLAVQESDYIKAIRNNVITVFVPVTEPDGRDRFVDTYNYKKANNNHGPNTIYWGKYAYHDNNRDGLALTLNLTNNVLASFYHWKPTVMHDLHESVSYLYVSTGLGPYNEYVDAITVDEWHNISHEEVTELTKRGMPGVWTHAFYNGWAANYLIWMANIRNSTGRFYETFGNGGADTYERKLRTSQTSKKWYRPNPPLKNTMWSLRNNTNYMQSGVLVALKYAADKRQSLVENFYIKSKNAVNAGKTKAPYAWVIDLNQHRKVAATNLVKLLLKQGAEVHQAEQKLSWTSKAKKKTKTHSAPKGSIVIRMDQPYRTLVQVLLDKQNFPKDARPPYDDVGWSLPLLRNVEVHKVADKKILSAKMNQITELGIVGRVIDDDEDYLVVNHTAEDNITVFRFKLKEIKMLAAEAAFEIDDVNYTAGSLIIPKQGNPDNMHSLVKNQAEKLGVTVQGVDDIDGIKTHEVGVPRVALVHTFTSASQNSGWWRQSFDFLEIPYTYLAEQDFATEDLSKFDVIILPRTWTSPQNLVSGNSQVGDPTPWKKTDTYTHIGVIDETDDTRRGMGYDGLKNLKTFIENGGVFITESTTSAFPIDFGITRNISIKRTRNLVARGSVYQSVRTDSLSPISYGYQKNLPVYFSSAPVFSINKNFLRNYRLPEWKKDEIWAKETPRPIISFAKKNLLLSGMLKGEKELAGAPAVVDVPVRKGHVVLFAIRPFWRGQTDASHSLVFNTMLHWNHLRLGWPERPKDDDGNSSSLLNEFHNMHNN